MSHLPVTGRQDWSHSMAPQRYDAQAPCSVELFLRPGWSLGDTWGCRLGLRLLSGQVRLGDEPVGA